MKWIIRVLAGGALLVAVVFGIGALLPVEHTATVSAEITGGPELVWTAITDVEALPLWRSGIDSIERLADSNGLPSWTEHAGSEAITYEAVESEAPVVLSTRIATEGLPFGGGWRIQIEPAGAGTSHVTITESGEVYSPIFRFVSRFVMGHDATMKQYLEDLDSYVGGS